MALTRGGKKRRSHSKKRKNKTTRLGKAVRLSSRVGDEVLDIVPPVGKFTRSVLHEVGISRGGKRRRHRRSHRR